MEKPKIHYKIVNQKGVFHKTPSSQFCLIETFFGHNPFSLITILKGEVRVFLCLTYYYHSG